MPAGSPIEGAGGSRPVLRHSQDELAEEVASGHDLVGLRGLRQVERLAHHAAQAAVAGAMHHRREAPATAGAAAHQGERPALQHRQVERDLATPGGPGDDEPAAGLEARAALVPHRRPDAVEHHVDAAAAGELLDALAELRRRRVVDDLVGAEPLGLRELPVAPGRDDRASAHALGHQEPEASDPAADGLDQDVLALLELYALEQAVPGSVTGERKRRRFLEPHALGDSLKIGRGNLAVLRVAAVELAAQALLPVAELVAPEHAWRAHAALDAILDHDVVAFFPAGHAGPETGDLAGARFRVRAVPEDQLLRASGFGDVDGFHRKIAWHLGALKIQVSTQSTSSIFAPSSAMAPARQTQFRTSCWPEASSRSSGKSRQVSYSPARRCSSSIRSASRSG